MICFQNLKNKFDKRKKKQSELKYLCVKKCNLKRNRKI